MPLPLCVVDAFTREAFRGNPAAVCLPGLEATSSWMQSVAAELNLSETAFAIPLEPGRWRLRWFTPKAEVELCGHATLATAFVLARELGQTPPFTFHTLSGPLLVEADGPRFMLDFPARSAEPAAPPAGLAAALGATPREVHRARDWICVLESPEQVATLAPDHAALAALPGPERVIVTAAGGEGVDITSRFFAVKVGVPEDPVTGTAHVQLVPFWATRLQRKTLVCRQASARGGTLCCTWQGDRVRMAGDAVLYAKGEIHLPDGI